MFGDQELKIEVADIYFIIGLSRKGQPVQLCGSHTREESTNILIARHCPRTKKTKIGKIYINTITNLPLQTILHTMAQVAGAQVLYEETKSHL